MHYTLDGISTKRIINKLSVMQSVINDIKSKKDGINTKYLSEKISEMKSVITFLESFTKEKTT